MAAAQMESDTESDDSGSSSDDDYEAAVIEAMETTQYGVVPASESSIHALEKKKFKEGDNKELDEACTVCLEKILTGVDVSLMPCSHLFHSTCIEQWLATSNKCPLCRFEMPT